VCHYAGRTSEGNPYVSTKMEEELKIIEKGTDWKLRGGGRTRPPLVKKSGCKEVGTRGQGRDKNKGEDCFT